VRMCRCVAPSLAAELHVFPIWCRRTDMLPVQQPLLPISLLCAV